MTTGIYCAATRWLTGSLCATSLSLALWGCTAESGEEPSTSEPVDPIDTVPSNGPATASRDAGAQADGSGLGLPDGGIEVPSGCEVVEFASPVVEASVRELIGVQSGPISGASLLQVTAIGFSAESLAGVECLPALRELSAQSGTIADLEPLRELKLLEHVSLTSNRIRDLSPLSDKRYLKRIWAGDNQIVDVSNLVLPEAPSVSSVCQLPDIELGDNPIGAEGVAHLCEQGWTVGWGGEASGVPYQTCNDLARCALAK